MACYDYKKCSIEGDICRMGEGEYLKNVFEKYVELWFCRKHVHKLFTSFCTLSVCLLYFCLAVIL